MSSAILPMAVWHHPGLVSYGFVRVMLCPHSSQGVTERDFALAQRIEEVGQWQPGREGGVLEGTPNDDARFRDIKCD